MSRTLRGGIGLLFVVAAMVLAVVGLSDSWTSIWDVASHLSWWRVAAPFVLVLVGVASTALVWSRALARCGHPLAIRDAGPVFFVGQLGKYLPGSVWSFGAVAVMLRRRNVPVSSSVAASLIFLLLHFAPGLTVAGVVVLTGHTRLPEWWGVGIALVGLVTLAPQVMRPVGRFLNRAGDFAWSWADALVVFASMSVAWSLYTGALFVTAPDAAAGDAPTIMAAFVLAFAAGVAVPVAPAGVGVREALLIYLLTPALGFEVAAAASLLSRVTHTVADLLLAGVLGALFHVRRGEHSNGSE